MKSENSAEFHGSYLDSGYSIFARSADYIRMRLPHFCVIFEALSDDVGKS